MKLHLTKSLRTAVLACICAAGQSMAADVPGINKFGDIWLLPSGTEGTTIYDITAADADKYLLLADQTNAKGNQKLSVADSLTVSVKLGEWHDSNTNATYEKLGGGTLAITGVGQITSNFSDGPKTAGTPEHAIVRDGVLDIAYGDSGNGFVQDSATVYAGGTLKLSVNDSLGYGGTYNPGDYVNTITLVGDSEAKKATLIVDEHQTMTTNINLNGNTEIKDGDGTAATKSLEAFGGKITATGTNNTISTQLTVRKNLEVNVAEALTISGAISFKSDSSDPEKAFTKTGAGTLTIASGVAVDSNVNFIVDEGVVKPEGNVDRSYVLRGGTLLLDNNRIGNDDGTTTGTITLVAETNGATSENTIKSGNAAGAVFADITGAGNLTLEKSVNVYADMDYTGNLTLKDGSYNIGHNGYGDSPTIANDGNITIASGATVKVDAKADNAATQIQNSGNIIVNGSLEVSKGTIANGGTITVSGTDSKLMVNSQAAISSDISVSNGGTLDVGNSPNMALSAITVGEEGVLDLRDTLTLTLEGLDLAAGTTIILGQSTHINITSALTIGGGVIFDVSGWCDYDSFSPYDLFTYTGTAENFAPTLPEFVTIKTSTGDNEKAWLEFDAGTGNVKLIPEPTTATLSLLALAGLAMRRRRK